MTAWPGPNPASPALQCLALASVLALAAVGLGAAETGTVRGTVAVKGQMSSANAVISIEAPGLKLTPAPEPVKIDQKGFRFIPHITVLVPGSTVRFLNNDPEPHNVYSPEGIRRVYEVDPLACPRCGAEMRVIGFITQRSVITRILDHLRTRERVSRPPPPLQHAVASIA